MNVKLRKKNKLKNDGRQRTNFRYGRYDWYQDVIIHRIDNAENEDAVDSTAKSH